MRRVFRYGALLLFLFCQGCSSHFWQVSRDITPISYQAAEEGVKRTVGKLRRLVILPVRYERNRVIFEGNPTEGQKKGTARTVLLKVKEHLVDWKGYEVVLLEMYEDIYPEKLGLTPDAVAKDIAALTDWARSAADGQPPPPEISAMAAEIGRPLNCDGVLVIQGHSRFCNAGYIATLLTASLAWPVWWACNDYEIRADLFEVATGRIVWRSMVSQFDDLWEKPEFAVGSAFSRLEPALPAAVILK